MSLTSRIFIFMISGIIVGGSFNIIVAQGWLPVTVSQWISEVLIGGVLDAIGQVFVASLKLMVVPLVFVSLVCGVSSLSDSSQMGTMALRTVSLYLVTTAVAISFALLIATLLSPGEGMEMASATLYEPKESPPLKEVIVNIFPSNPIKAMVEANMLQIIVFALFLGFAITRCGEQGQRIAAFFKDFEMVIMTMVKILMQLAPYGVFCLLAKLCATLGFDALGSMAMYMLTVIVALAVQMLGVYTFLLRFMTGLNPRILLTKMRPAMMFAFSTASSAATMPVTMRTVEQRLGATDSVAAFTVPLGATINMDGTAIMQGAATVFIAQAFNVDMGLADYLTVIATATMASIGTAAVPGVGLITLAMVLQQVGLPVEGIAMIIGVDRLLDMLRTAVNITGDATVSIIVAQKENMLDQSIYDDWEAGKVE